MRRILLLIIMISLGLSGCSFNKFEPYVYQQVEVIEVGDTSDPTTFLRDVEKVGLQFEVLQSNLNTNTPGEYQITYKISLDKKSLEKTYTIKVADTEPPVITAPDSITIVFGGTFVLEDYVKAVDERDGDVSDSLHYTGSVNAYNEDTYRIVIYAQDQFGNEAQKEMLIKVEKSIIGVTSVCGEYKDTTYQDGQQPVLTLNEDNTFALYLNSCAVINLVEGKYKQYLDTLYLVADNHGFSLKDEENIISFEIQLDGSLKLNTSLELCAPNYGDIFVKEK